MIDERGILIFDFCILLEYILREVYEILMDWYSFIERNV